MATSRLLTIADLCERWGLDPTSQIVMEHVHKGTLKFVDLSPTGVKRSGKGQKTIRFRPADVEAFEADRVRAFAENAKPDVPQAKARELPAMSLPGWDGKVRGRGAKPAGKKSRGGG